MQKVLKFASLFKKAANNSVHQWAANIVNQAFKQVMGRSPNKAERQIVMAVSSLESGYGRGWGKGQSTSGEGSHNWGAVQTYSKTTPTFTHGDSSAEGKYNTRFKAYPDDISGAADVVRLLFKGSRKQHMPDPNHEQRALGPEIPGPGRGELITEATENGDTLAFSKAMWYTSYYEGFASTFTKRIADHAKGIQNKINAIASALGEAPEWSIKSDNYLPVTNNLNIINQIKNMEDPNIEKSVITNTKPVLQQQKSSIFDNKEPETVIPDITGIESMLWFN